MNSDWVTALLVDQHRADLLRAADQHRLAETARQGRMGREREDPAPAMSGRGGWRSWWARRGARPVTAPGPAPARTGPGLASPPAGRTAPDHARCTAVG